MAQANRLFKFIGAACFLYLAAFCLTAAGGAAAVTGGNQIASPAIVATWVWNTQETIENREDFFTFARERHINHVYLYYDASLEKGAYREFIRDASANGIEVHALGGEPDWVLAENRKKLEVFIRSIHMYNAAVEYEERFRGIHLDMEPYLLEEWDRHSDTVVRQWIDTVNSLKTAQMDPALAVGADLPFWLDEHTIDIGGKKTELGRWMMRQFDYVTFMAYRNKAEGAGGILDIMAEETAAGREERAFFLVGVETGQTAEDYVTFRHIGESALFRELDKVQAELEGRPGYLGIAVHHYASWKSLAKHE